jgi:hypothetical protein
MQHWPRLENKNRCLMRLFFRITQYSADAYNTHAYLPYPYEHLWITELIDLEIHEITTGASLSTGVTYHWNSESIVPLNPGKIQKNTSARAKSRT